MFDIISILRSLRKNIFGEDILSALGITLLYFITRLVNLDKFPIFSDEGIYIHWAKIAWHDATWRFISLTDGKQPLQTWGTIPFLKLFPDNALLGGRLFAVSTGFFALIGMYFLLTYLWGKRAGMIGSLLYVLTPYFLFYDRLALVDSGVNAFFIWILFLSILLARTLRLDVALFMGIMGGIGMLSKSSFVMFIGLSALAPILFFERNHKRFFSKVLSYEFLFGIVAVLSLVIYNVQRLSPFFHYVGEKNNTFVMTFAEFKQNPLAVFFNNIQLIPEYVLWELGFVVGLCGLIGLWMLVKKDWKLALYIFSWIAGPFVIVLFLNKVLFPRYIIFFGTLLTILATYYFTFLKNKTAWIVSFVLFLLSSLFMNHAIIFNPARLPFPPVDRGQYVEGWPAGWGIKESMEYAREKSKEKPVIILAEGNFGLAGDVLDTYLKRNDNIQIKGYWPLEEKELMENQKDLDKNYVYVVLSHKFEYPASWPLKLVKRFDKPGNQSVIYLLELQKQEKNANKTK